LDYSRQEPRPQGILADGRNGNGTSPVPNQ